MKFNPIVWTADIETVLVVENARKSVSLRPPTNTKAFSRGDQSGIAQTTRKNIAGLVRYFQDAVQQANEHQAVSL